MKRPTMLSDWIPIIIIIIIFTIWKLIGHQSSASSSTLSLASTG